MKYVPVFLICFCCLKSIAQTEQSLIGEAVKLEAALNESGALEKLTRVLQINPNHYFALWKASELCSRIGSKQPTKKEKMAYFIIGRKYAESAIKTCSKCADGYYALSVAMGKLALTAPNKDKIEAVKGIKSNVEKALQFNPEHGRAWHVLGKWHYEVDGLNVMERTAVKIMYGGLPPASIEQSISAYEKAKQLEPNFALNYLELAKAYIRAGKKEQAIALLQKLPSISTKTSDDNQIKAEGKILLKELTN
jgi:tetratricopeptide (TPR) repeat protein